MSVREKLVMANRILANEGILRGFGHVSVRDPDSDHMLISQSRSPAFVTESDILEVTLDGEVIDDDRTTYIENVIHRAIYRARPDVHAVVHHHAAAIMPFAIADVELRPVFHQGMLFYDGVPTFDDYDREGGWLIVTEDEAARLAENLGSHRAQLLRGHGANTVGASLEEVITTTYNFVLNAQHQASAMAIGKIAFDPQDDEMARVTTDEIELSSTATERLWEYLVGQIPESSLP